MMPHSMAEVYKLFIISILMMEALSSSEMMAPIRLHGVTTRRWQSMFSHNNLQKVTYEYKPQWLC